MKESISSRIRRIITGTANSIVSKIEGLAPEAVLKQAIREVDGAIDEVRAEMGSVAAQKHHVTKAISKLNNEHAQITEQLEIAVGEARKDLVEIAVSRQVDIEDQLPALETQLGDCSSQIIELEQAITGLVAKRNEMEDELFDFQHASTGAGDKVGEIKDNKNRPWYYQHLSSGFNYRMNDLSAALGLSQINRLKKFIY